MPDAPNPSSKLQFSSLEELQKSADLGSKTTKLSTVKALEKTLPKLDVMLKQARIDGEDETTYIVASRYFEILRTVQKSKPKDDKTWFSKYTNPGEVMKLLERLKESLAMRYKSNMQANSISAPLQRGKSPSLSYGQNHVVHQSDKKSEDTTVTMDTRTSTEITARDLSVLLKTNDNSVLLLDLRSQEEFENSHIKARNIINLPQTHIEEPVTASTIEKSISTEFKAIWRTRQVFDKVVILDGGTNKISESPAVDHLTSVLIEFSSEPIKSPPLLLTGGFYGFVTGFPHLTSDPQYRAPRQEATKMRNLMNLRFPSRKIFSDAENFPPTVSPKAFRKGPETISNNFLPEKDGPVYIGDVLYDNNVLPKIQHPNNRKRSPTPEPAATRRLEVEADPRILSMPSVNRGLKPRQSSTLIPSDTSLSSNKSENGYDASASSNTSDNGYDDVLNNAFVNHSRGSGEYGEDFDSKSQTLPTVKRSIPTLPSVSRTSKPPVYADSSQTNVRSNPSSNEENYFRPASVDNPEERPINELNNAGARDASSRSSTLPAGAKLSKMAKDDFFDSSPTVRNIPIIVEDSNNNIPAKAIAPQPQRALKPLDTNRPRQTAVNVALPEYPHFSSWKPCLEKQTDPGRTGLGNPGNTCYMNGVLQCLSHTRLVRNYYLRNEQGEKEYRKYVNPYNNRGTKGEISVCMDQLMELLWCGRYRYITPVFMKNALEKYKREEFKGREQQDAFSALSAILGLLHQDTNRAKMVGASSEERRLALKETEDSNEQTTTELILDAQKKHKLITDSFIDRLLMFLKENVVQCPCGYESRTFTCDQMLNLWFPPVSNNCRPPDRSELTDLLTAEMRPPEPIEYKCKKCGRTGNAKQRHYFHSDPDILVVQFKRFGDSYSDDEDRYSKDTRLVNFNHTLSLAQFYRNSAGRKSDYRLYAVLDHIGMLNSGHYIANCLHSDTGKWLKFNDETVTELHGAAPRELISSQAYILFYERLS